MIRVLQPSPQPMDIRDAVGEDGSTSSIRHSGLSDLHDNSRTLMRYNDDHRSNSMGQTVRSKDTVQAEQDNRTRRCGRSEVFPKTISPETAGSCDAADEGALDDTLPENKSTQPTSLSEAHQYVSSADETVIKTYYGVQIELNSMISGASFR